MRLDWTQISGLRVTVMGLGLHGGGVATAEFFARHGALVTVTDLGNENRLAPSIEKLASYPSIRYVLGRHEIADFENADMVVKNPAVPGSSPYLKASRRVESDISVFLSLVDAPLIAVTGTKGKSTTATAIHHVLKEVEPDAKLGGNITVSPLIFADELRSLPHGPSIVLELSSWQLADLRGRDILHPRTAVITNILPDHMNRYANMDDYVSDKQVIVDGQSSRDITICRYDDFYTPRFVTRTRAAVQYFSDRPLPSDVDGAWIEDPGNTGRARIKGSVETILPDSIKVPGSHNRLNLLAAGLAARSSGVPPEIVARALSTYPGIRHRMEYVATIKERAFYNDSAATIPEAAVAAVDSFTAPVVLIAGGTDKVLDFTPFSGFAKPPERVVILAGSASAKIVSVLTHAGVPYLGPLPSIEEAVRASVECSHPGNVILLSPGCTSFEMFKNEFDRGDNFVRVVHLLESQG